MDTFLTSNSRYNNKDNKWETLTPTSGVRIADNAFEGSPCHIVVDQSFYQDFLSSDAWEAHHDRIGLYISSAEDIRQDGAIYSYMRDSQGNAVQNDAAGREVMRQNMVAWNADYKNFNAANLLAGDEKKNIWYAQVVGVDDSSLDNGRMIIRNDPGTYFNYKTAAQGVANADALSLTTRASEFFGTYGGRDVVDLGLMGISFPDRIALDQSGIMVNGAIMTRAQFGASSLGQGALKNGFTALTQCLQDAVPILQEQINTYLADLAIYSSVHILGGLSVTSTTAGIISAACWNNNYQLDAVRYAAFRGNDNLRVVNFTDLKGTTGFGDVYTGLDVTLQDSCFANCRNLANIDMLYLVTDGPNRIDPITPQQVKLGRGVLAGTTAQIKMMPKQLEWFEAEQIPRPFPPLHHTAHGRGGEERIEGYGLLRHGSHGLR